MAHNPFDKVQSTATKQRQSRLSRKPNKSKLKDKRQKRAFGDLGNMAQLTHKGQPIDLNMNDTIYTSEDESVDYNDPNIMKKQTLNDVIAKHKAEKYQRQQEHAIMEQKAMELNEKFHEIRHRIKPPTQTHSTPDAYDRHIVGFQNDKRAMAVDRRKTIEELVNEEKAKLQEASSEEDEEALSDFEENPLSVLPPLSVFFPKISSDYLRTLRIKHFDDPIAIKQLGQLMVESILHVSIATFEVIYPHLYSIAHDHPEDVAKALYDFMPQSPLLCTGDALITFFLFISKVYSPGSVLQSYMSVLAPLLSTHHCTTCHDRLYQLCLMMHRYALDKSIYIPEIYMYGLRHHTDHPLLQALTPLPAKDTKELFVFPKDHPMRHTYASLLNQQSEETHIVQLQKKPVQLITTAIPQIQVPVDEKAKLKRKIKHMRKSTMRLIRSDASYLSKEKVKQIKKSDKQYKDYINRVMGSIGNEVGQKQTE